MSNLAPSTNTTFVRNYFASGDTTLAVKDTTGFPSDGLLSVGDGISWEIVEYSGLTADTFTGVIRAQYGTNDRPAPIGNTVIGQTLLGTAAETDTGTSDGNVPIVPVPASALEFTPYPVGAIFLSAVSDDPATLLGYGTWTAIGAGKVLVGLNSGDPDFDTLGETGGAKTVTPTGTNSAPTFTGSALSIHSHGVGTIAPSAHSGTAVASHPAHTHDVTTNVAVANHTFTQPTISWPASVPTASGAASNVSATINEPSFTITGTKFSTSASGTAAATAYNGVTIGNGATSVTNPAQTVTVTNGTMTQPTIAWPASVPTNAGGAVSAHFVTNNAVTSGDPSATLNHSVTQPSDHTMSGSTASVSAGTPAGTVSAPTFTGDAMSVVQPYLVIMMWQRVS